MYIRNKIKFRSKSVKRIKVHLYNVQFQIVKKNCVEELLVQRFYSFSVFYNRYSKVCVLGEAIQIQKTESRKKLLRFPVLF